MTKIINIANFKGGVGKTTTTVLFSYLLAMKKNEKVLLVDFDPQANATDLIYKTFNIDYEDIETSIYEAMIQEDLKKAVVKCNDNLHIIPADSDLRNYSRLLMTKLGDDYTLYPFFLDALLKPLKEEYDYIFIDVPPTISDYTDSAIIASDYLMIVMQTQEFSLSAAEQYLPYVSDLLEHHDTSIQFVATIPVLLHKKGKTDQFILEQSRRTFGNKFTTNQIQIRERIKAWGLLGIKDEDMHDKAVLEMYTDLLDEILEKMEE